MTQINVTTSKVQEEKDHRDVIDDEKFKYLGLVDKEELHPFFQVVFSLQCNLLPLFNSSVAMINESKRFRINS